MKNPTANHTPKPAEASSNAQATVKVPYSSDQRLKFYLSKEVIEDMANRWMLVDSYAIKIPFFTAWRTKRKLINILTQFSKFAGFRGDVHIFINKNPKNKKDTEFLVTSSAGKDAVIKFYDNITTENRESWCSIPGFDNYDRHFSLIQDEVITFFSLDLERMLVIPMFNKKYYSEDGAIVASRCIQLAGAPHNAMVTFEIERFKDHLFFTMLVSNRTKHLELVEAYSATIVNELNRVDPNKTSYDCYKQTKQLLDEVCSSFIIEVDELKDSSNVNKIGNCKNKLIVKDNIVFSFMLFDPIKTRAITVFANQDWVCETAYQEVSKNGQKIHQSEIVVDSFDIDNVPSLKEIRKEVPEFILNNLWFAFADN